MGGKVSRLSDEAFNALLERLEISILKLSQTKKIIDFRIDANTYVKEYLETEKLLNTKNNKKIQGLITSIQNFGAYSLCNYIEFLESGTSYLMTQNIQANYINYSNLHHISNEVHQILHKSHCKKGQVLLTMAGAYLGRAAVFNENFESSSNQAIAKISLKNEIEPFYVSTFLNTFYGQNQINRLKTVTGQPNINMSQIRELLIPILSKEFQNKIKETVLKAYETRKTSKNLYTSVEMQLLNALGLSDYQPSKENAQVKSLKDSFLNSGRLDSEYYQPKYEEIEEKIKNYGFVKIRTVFYQNTERISFEKEGYNYIEISDISVSDGKATSSYRLTGDLPANAKIKIQKGDLLISKVRPNRGAVSIIDIEKENLVASGAFTVLREKENKLLNKETLQILLRTNIYKELLLKYNCGSSYPVIKDEDILNLIIPLITTDLQTEIANSIQRSFQLKNQSKQLLHIAKTGVEKAIESSESAAMTWMETEILKLN